MGAKCRAAGAADHPLQAPAVVTEALLPSMAGTRYNRGTMIAIALLLAAATPGSRVAAVLELRNKLEGADRNLVDAAFLTDVVRQQALEAVPSLKLMTRENVLTLLEASGKKLEECEGECEVETGRRLGADIVVTGELLRFGRGFRVNLRLHDTHTAQLLAAAVASGETPEALEKDMARAVAKLMTPLSVGQPERAAKDPEWYETIGFYLTGALGSIAAENDTPRALAAPVGSITMSNLRTKALGIGLGVRYQPQKWLMLDVAYYFSPLSAQADSRSGNGYKDSEQAFGLNGSAAATANFALRLAHVLRAFAGAGAQLFAGEVGNAAAIDGNGIVYLSTAGGSGPADTKLFFVRPCLRLGIEWRPQERVGIDLFGVLYPIPKEIDVYVVDSQSAMGTADPLLKYRLPAVTANGAVVLYF
jgi:TolB-like protein